MGAIEGLVEAAKLAFDRKDKAAQAKQDRRDAAADYYHKISDTLKDVATKLRRQENPHGSCQKILKYGQDLPATIGDVIGVETAEALSKKLIEAHEVELLLIELSKADNPEQKLSQLEQAAGDFEASADSLRAGPTSR